MNNKRGKSKIFTFSPRLDQKRGLSTVVVTLIMILLVLVAVGIIWAVVKNILETGTEEVSTGFGQIFLDLSIESVLVEDNGDISVYVKRGSGEGDISGLNLIVSDGTNSEVIKIDNVDLDQLEEKKFTITQSDLGDVGFAKEVSVAPVTVSSSGKEDIGSVVDTLELSNKKVLENLGAVSWWKLNGNARDEIGDNHGTLQGDVTFVDGKYGKAGSFDGVDDYVTIADSPSLRILDYSVIVWIKPNGVPSQTWKGIVGKPGRNYNFWLHVTGLVHHRFHTTTSWNAGAPNTPSGSISWDEWNYVVLTNDGTTAKTYINSEEKASGAVSGTLIADSTTFYISRNLDGNNGNYFNGLIDEVIIFNRALVDKEVKGLYKMDLENT